MEPHRHQLPGGSSDEAGTRRLTIAHDGADDQCPRPWVDAPGGSANSRASDIVDFING
jgi:hypothetical protein